MSERVKYRDDGMIVVSYRGPDEAASRAASRYWDERGMCDAAWPIRLVVESPAGDRLTYDADVEYVPSFLTSRSRPCRDCGREPEPGERICYECRGETKRAEFARRLEEARKLVNTSPSWKRTSLGPPPSARPAARLLGLTMTKRSSLPRAAARGRLRDRARAALRARIARVRSSEFWRLPGARVGLVLLIASAMLVTAIFALGLPDRETREERAIRKMGETLREVEERVLRIEAAVSEWRRSATEWRSSLDLYRLERAAERRIEFEDVLCVLRPLGLRWRSDLPVPSAWRPLAEGVPIPTAEDCDSRYGAPTGRAP